MKTKLLKVSVIVSFIITLLINGLAGTTVLNNITTAAVSEKYSNFFVPAGYVFSIWGVIYIFLILFTYYQIKHKVSDKIRLYVIAINLLNALWLIMWHYDYLNLSVAIMLTILSLLIITYLEIRKIRFENKLEVFSLNYPFSIYLGWISVATIANISAALTKADWGGFGLSDETWGVKMIVTATLLGVVMLVSQRDKIYSLVIIWALFGIYMNFQDSIVGMAGLICSIVLIALVTLQHFKIIFKK